MDRQAQPPQRNALCTASWKDGCSLSAESLEVVEKEADYYYIGRGTKGLN